MSTNWPKRVWIDQIEYELTKFQQDEYELTKNWVQVDQNEYELTWVRIDHVPNIGCIEAWNFRFRK